MQEIQCMLGTDRRKDGSEGRKENKYQQVKNRLPWQLCNRLRKIILQETTFPPYEVQSIHFTVLCILLIFQDSA